MMRQQEETAPASERGASAHAELEMMLANHGKVTADYSGGKGNMVSLSAGVDGVYISWRVWGPAGLKYSIPGVMYASVRELLECQPELIGVTEWKPALR